MGWVVLRFWGEEIKNNLKECVREIKNTIYEINNETYYYKYNDINDFLAAENENEYGT